MGMYCTLESGRRGVGWGLLSGQNKVSCCLDFVGPSLFKINPCCLELPKGWLISLFLVPRKSFLLRALFFLLAFSHKNVEQIQWHITITLRKKYSPGKKTPLEKGKISILCTHPFFCDSYLPYYRKLTLHEIKILEINATQINANLLENDCRIKKINAKEEVQLHNKGN